MYKIPVSFDSTYLVGLDDTTPVTMPATEYELEMMLQALLMLNDRRLWQDMSDNDWNNLQAKIAVVLEKVQT